MVSAIRVRCELCVTALRNASDASKFYADNAAREHLSLKKSVPCSEFGSDNVRWRASHWGTSEDVCSVEYRADGKQRFYTFVAVMSPPLKWQATVASKYPELNFVLSYESEDNEFSGYVSYADGRRVGQHGGDLCLRRSLARVIQRYEAEERAMTTLRPAVLLYVMDRLYRHPDGLRLPAVQSHFEAHTCAFTAR